MLNTRGAPPRLEVLAVKYGEFTTRRSELFHDFAAYGEPDGEVTMDYYFWVVRGEGRTLLVDTGFTPEAARSRNRTCLIPPVEAARDVGLTPETVPQVLVTHFHYDHIGNLGAFPESEVLVSGREYEYWTSALKTGTAACGAINPDEIAAVERAHRSGRVRLLPDRAEIMPGVTALTVGGHTPGQLVVVVEAENGSLILASDAVHLDEELEKDRAFAVFTDLDDMYRAYGALRDLSAELDARIVPGHEPRVTSRHPLAPEHPGGRTHRLL